MRWSNLQRFSITSGAAFVLLGLGGAVSYYFAVRLTTSERFVTRANQNINAAFRIIAGTQDAERATKAYVIRGDSLARGVLQAAQSAVEDAITDMNQASEDNPLQRRLLESLAPQVAASFGEFRRTLEIRDHLGADSARRFLVRESPPHESDSLMKIVTQMRDEELRILAEHARHQSQTGQTTLRVILLGTALAFLLAGFALQPMRSGVAARLATHLASTDDAAEGGAAAGPTADGSTASSARLQALQRLIAGTAVARDAADGARALVATAVDSFSPTLAVVIAPSGAGGFSVLHASDPSLHSVSPDVAGPVAETLRTNTPVFTPSRATRERRFGTLAGLDTLGASGALLFVPLSRDASVAGVLLIAFATDRDLDTDELAFAASLGLLGWSAVASGSHSS